MPIFSFEETTMTLKRDHNVTTVEPRFKRPQFKGNLISRDFFCPKIDSSDFENPDLDKLRFKGQNVLKTMSIRTLMTRF